MAFRSSFEWPPSMACRETWREQSESLYRMARIVPEEVPGV